MKFLFLSLIVLFVSGCANGTDKIHDSRFGQGCAVVEGRVTATLFSGETAACKAVCSDKLPIGYNYKYKSNFCEFNISN